MKLLKHLSLCLVLLLAAVFVQAQHTDDKPPPAQMPTFKFYDIEGQPYTNKQLPAGKPYLLFYYNSECDHCVLATNQLKQVMPVLKLKNVQVLMLSAETEDKIAAYYGAMSLDKYDNLEMLRDKDRSMHFYYEFRNTPYVILYGADQKVIKYFETGMIEESALKAVLK
jgi:cytochrome oxidase Cu insertion factor (SCO1/SenC/PrrC family)